MKLLSALTIETEHFSMSYNLNPVLSLMIRDQGLYFLQPSWRKNHDPHSWRGFSFNLRLQNWEDLLRLSKRQMAVQRLADLLRPSK